MKYGLSLINFSSFFQPSLLMEFAVEAEDAGWDGIFIWDHLTITFTETPVVDPWIALSAIATVTKKIRIGPMITPVARRRPWKLARETVSLDHLSKGRLILGVGLGVPECFSLFGEETNSKTRAEKMDEGLDIITGLWSGEAFSYNGKFFKVEKVRFLPKPIQQPRIPIIVGGSYLNKAPFKRAARFDGVVPINPDFPNPLTPNMLRNILKFIKKERGDLENYLVFISGDTSEDQEEGAKKVYPYIKAGANWWLEDISGLRGSIDKNLSRIRAGPPKI
jgi:alkanesulfonate monooxygenase SsuD/methylene tetrahydromethanopterin reductase-like flavin-dependent oxidoreductase (luciferase family)